MSPDDRPAARSDADGTDALSRRAVMKTVGAAAIFGEELPGRPASTDSGGPGRRADVPSRPAATLADGGTRFGAAVALDGSTAAIGTPPGFGAAGRDAGRVALFASEDDGWTRAATLAPDGAPGADFGAAVAAHGDAVLVGAPLPSEPNGPHGGSATVFVGVDGDWRRHATLSSADPSGVDRFGAAVALAGDTALVGAPAAATERGPRGGSASVFARAGGTWTREATLDPGSAGTDEFGRAVALGGDVAVVGARTGSRGPPGGRAVVFARDGGRWSKRAVLAPPRGERAGGFGRTLATDGETIVVGAPRAADRREVDAGAAYVFARTAGTWTRQATLRDRTAGGRRFGLAVAVDDGRALVGSARGDGVAYARGGGGWTRRTTLRPDVGPARASGIDVALGGSRGLVGVPRRQASPRDGRLEVFAP